MEKDNKKNHRNILIFKFCITIDDFEDSNPDDIIEFFDSYGIIQFQEYLKKHGDENLKLGEIVDAILKMLSWEYITKMLDRDYLNNIITINGWYLDKDRDVLIESFIDIKDETINFIYEGNIVFSSNIIGDADNYREYEKKAELNIKSIIIKDFSEIIKKEFKITEEKDIKGIENNSPFISFNLFNFEVFDDTIVVFFTITEFSSFYFNISLHYAGTETDKYVGSIINIKSNNLKSSKIQKIVCDYIREITNENNMKHITNKIENTPRKIQLYKNISIRDSYITLEKV